MNKETKQLFKNQLAIMNSVNHIMVNTCVQDSGDFQKELIESYVETEELLDPKEVVPYEDSLEDNEKDVCAKCGYFRSAHKNKSFWDKVNVCGEFVKSSSKENHSLTRQKGNSRDSSSLSPSGDANSSKEEKKNE